jgi:hypothetical protein
MPSLELQLILVFARLVHQHERDVLNFLQEIGVRPLMSNTNQIENVNLFEFVLRKWVERHGRFEVLYHLKVRYFLLGFLCDTTRAVKAR